MNNLQIIITADGSHSLLDTTLNETYHSRHGAVQESNHVFIKNGFDYYISTHHIGSVSILEVGFGTGLNAWLTLQRSCLLNQKVRYTSIDTHPLQDFMWQSLNYTRTTNEEDDFHRIHKAKWNMNVPLNQHFVLHKVETSLQEFNLIKQKFDIVYFDAFAPNKQPELWDITLLKKITESINPKGIFVTYCAKGQLKRDLKSLGLSVETLLGPPGKKEMVRGVKL